MLRGDLFWLLKQVYSPQKLHGLLFDKLDTSVSHMLNGLFTTCDMWLASSYLGNSWRVPHVGHEMLTLSGTHDFTPSGEFSLPLGSSWFHPFIPRKRSFQISRSSNKLWNEEAIYFIEKNIVIFDQDIIDFVQTFPYRYSLFMTSIT